VRALSAAGVSPTETITKLNETLRRFSMPERFCTLFYAHLRPSETSLVVDAVSAGHPPALVVRDDERVDACGARGLALGLFDEIPLRGDQLVLGPGDALVVYTDGIIESRDGAGRPFGEDSLAALLATSTGRSAAAIARRIELAALDHQAHVDGDDMAVVVVRVRP
jgi:serine phosphatase RsbU (regulator of sigma subunit)